MSEKMDKESERAWLCRKDSALLNMVKMTRNKRTEKKNQARKTKTKRTQEIEEKVWDVQPRVLVSKRL